ncbi:sensor histidine kinase [Paenibacillus sp. N4]|uniref:sensor histidine kinase n=1 Tax=Paenibacillus vietnamensis TaxID=2590547 RepID=UPI001CD11362|nr:sensor histidine kinase [Paenibacillus vietnamensis]MCA0753444.1 sensor histidine kinase [Paenibacillus vietnamensis]
MKNMRIVQKMALGYLLLVLLPIIVFGGYLYNQFYMDVMSEYSEGKQKLVVQAGEGFRSSLNQVESLHALLLNNQQLIEYLSGYYRTELQHVYNYLKDIRPLFIYAQSRDNGISSIKLYKTLPKVHSVKGELEDLNQMDGKPLALLSEVNVDEGVWLRHRGAETSALPSLSYYQYVYNNSYTKPLAVLEINTNDSLLHNFLKAVDVNRNMQMLIVQDGETVYRNEGNLLDDEQTEALLAMADESEQGYAYLRKQRMLVNSLSVPELSTTFYFFSQMDEVFVDIRTKVIVLGLTLLVSLVVLTGIYYATASSLVRRILGLAKHMRHVDESKLTYYKVGKSNDEIDFLTRSYNSLVSRIDELLNTVHKAELMKKEADYLVLQAQIKPHFLYNTLESIRMLAEINNDQEVVDATYTFGRLLRYTLNAGENETELRHEIDNVRHYLEMHKLRMLDRLSFSIQVMTNIDDFRCPRFILQPLVENCIQHGIGRSRKPGVIDIVIKRENRELLIVIADNGPGIPQDRLVLIRDVLGNERDRQDLQSENSGYGLYNVNERIRAFYGGQTRLLIDSREGEGAAFTLKLAMPERRHSKD